MDKPGYTLTRRAFWLAFVLAWGVIGAIVAGAIAGSDQAVAVAPVIVPSMVLMICTLLGIHRGFGSLDLRARSGVDGKGGEA